jgi:hypothetical protein
LYFLFRFNQDQRKGVETMKTSKTVLTSPPDQPAAHEVQCPYCNGTGYYQPLLAQGDAHYGEEDYYEPCPFCDAYKLATAPHIAPPDAPYDPEPKASGHELQVFAAIGVLCMLIAAVVGIIRAISLSQAGAIPHPFHDGFGAAWVLFGLSTGLIALGVALIVTHRKHRR